MNVGVIGAGATGLAAAHVLAKGGHEVTVLERNAEVGGLVSSLRVQGTSLERFYHHLFATDRAVIALIEELSLGSDLTFTRPPTGMYYDGRLHPFGTLRDVLRFPPIGIADRARFVASSAYLKACTRHDRFEKVDALGWMTKHAGRRATEVIWEPLLDAKFGRHAGAISMAWLWARIHDRTFRLGYLRGGFERLYSALADAIAARGGEVVLGASVARIERSSGRIDVTCSDGSSRRFDRLIVTIPPIELARATGGRAVDVAHSPAYLGATCFVLELERSLIPYYWLNVNDADFPFPVVVEHTRMVEPAEYGGRHVVYVGNYVAADEWRFTTEPEALLERYLPFLERLSPGFERGHVSSWHFTKAAFAQPVVTTAYRETIPPRTTSIEGVYLASMAQVYPQDRGQNAAVAMGQEVARSILDGHA